MTAPLRSLPNDDSAGELDVLERTPGRAVLAEPDGSVHVSRNYAIYRSNDDGHTWSAVTRLPRSPVRRAVEASRLACRLFRHEVRALIRLREGTYVASSREGIFFGRGGDPVMQRSRIEERGHAVMPPMRLCEGPDGTVVWGEYGSPKAPRPVRLYASHDGGRSFSPVHTLEAGDVLHVHNVVWDAGAGHYWVLAGDYDREPGIGRLSSDLARFEWFVKGEQRYRAVHVFDFGDRLVYATDTHVEGNGLIALDKTTGRTELLRDFEGSCIYACRFGGIYALTTSVEPSAVNRSPWAGLWVSRDGEKWRCAWRARKDRWNADYFQFGSIVLPCGETDREVLFFSGQAVQGIDGQTLCARLAD